MFTHALTRALRKNKTLRYGVPMLVSALKKKCGGGIMGSAPQDSIARRGTALCSGWLLMPLLGACVKFERAFGMSMEQEIWRFLK